ASAAISTEATGNTLNDLRQDSIIWYRIHVLLYDICSIAKDVASQKRIDATTDELYISEPHFTPAQATRIKSTMNEISTNKISTSGERAEEVSEEHETETTLAVSTDSAPKMMTIEEAIKSRLAGFLEKRKASGDARPCGPHDLGPIYMAVFGISKEALQDEKFLARLRRS
ncbi:putative C6 transcription factor, partial [Tothia fuscella]